MNPGSGPPPPSGAFNCDPQSRTCSKACSLDLQLVSGVCSAPEHVWLFSWLVVQPSIMQVSAALLLLLQGCCTAVRGWKGLRNSATELLPDSNRDSPRGAQQVLQSPHGQNHTVENRAKNGGRASNTVSYSKDQFQLIQCPI